MKTLLKYFLLFVLCVVSIIMFTNFYVIVTTKSDIVYDYSDLKADAILVLGAGINKDKPSLMLKERLDEAYVLYKFNVSDKIIVSGDHSRDGHDEVSVMKKYLIDLGVNSSDIFMDHAGFSTYDSVYRCKEIFEVKTAVIVTQKYHLYRALYIADSLGLNAKGVSATKKIYKGQIMREIREIAARDKDVVKSLFKMEPKYLGEVIPVSSDGNMTNDKGSEVN